MSRTKYLVRLAFVYAVLSMTARIIFILYNKADVSISFPEAVNSVVAGIPSDLCVIGWCLLVPWVVCAMSAYRPGLRVRRILLPFLIFAAFLTTFSYIGDLFLYEQWKFKLHGQVFIYMMSPAAIGDSLSFYEVLRNFGSAIMLMAIVVLVTVMITPGRIEQPLPVRSSERRKFIAGGVVIAFLIAGGFTSVLGVGSAYHNRQLFLNHASANPLVNMMGTTLRMLRPYQKQYEYLDDEMCDNLFKGLYPEDTEDITDTLLNSQRPNILFIQLESFGARYIEKIGGLKDVSPELDKWIGRGVFFDSVYANSFRTDRGTLCTMSGCVTIPTSGYFAVESKVTAYPSVASSLAGEGYSTELIYGSSLKDMGEGDYLSSIGFRHLFDVDGFRSIGENCDAWGANDSISLDYLYDAISGRDLDSHWFTVYQSISSHQPWNVSYGPLSDIILNSFSYTDHYVGKFLDRISQTPQWDNLLVVLYADHSNLYHQTLQDHEFFHIPLLMLGGAVKEPRVISVIMNQSDIAATLLSQLGISHKGYLWSRNVLSQNYTDPFAYSSYPAGTMFKDSTGVTMFDIVANKPVSQLPTADKDRILRMKAILQSSYDWLAE